MNRSLYGGLIVVALLTSVVLPWLVPNFYVFLVTKILFLSLASASLILLAGYGGMLSLAQIAFYGVAGYIVGYCGLRVGMGFMPTVFLAILGAAVTGALFALIAIRTSGLYFLMMTLALGQIAFFGAFQWAEVTGGYDGMNGIPSPVLFGHEITSGTALYYFTLVPVAAGFFWLKQLVASPFGLALQGIRDGEVRMAALGFNVKAHRFLAIVFSAAVAGAAGVLSIGRLEGAFIGALVYVLIEDYASLYTSRDNTVIGVFFIFIVLFFPKGIAEIFRRRKTTKSPQAA